MDDSSNVHGVVMDGDAVTSLQRFSEFKSSYFLFRLRVLKGLIEAESLDFRGTGLGPPRQSLSHLTFWEKGFLAHRQSRFKTWYGTVSPI
jgi:hypothetical protein